MLLQEDKNVSSSRFVRCFLTDELVGLLCVAAFLLLRSHHVLVFAAGVLLMGVAHAVITIKGTHLASHGSLSESQAWGKFWAVFFIEVRCSETHFT